MELNKRNSLYPGLCQLPFLSPTCYHQCYRYQSASRAGEEASTARPGHEELTVRMASFSFFGESQKMEEENKTVDNLDKQLKEDKERYLLKAEGQWKVI